MTLSDPYSYILKLQYSTLNYSKMVQDRAILTTSADKKGYGKG